MKVLILGNCDYGLYKFRKELIQRFLKEKYEVVISTPYGECIPLLEKMGCRYISLDYDRAGKNLLAEWSLLVGYRRILKKGKYDVVLLYTIKPVLYAGLLCRIRKVPYIANITGLSPAVTESSILKRICFFLYRRVLPYAGRVFFQNKENLRLFQQNRASGKNWVLVPGSGINLQEHCYEPYQEDKVIQILFVGRIVRLKGIGELLEAIEELYQKRLDVAFGFVGECDEAYLDRIEKMVREGKLVYYGFCAHPHEYMKKAQALILPSYGEGMSNVLLEASACGRPVLASNVAGCREIVQEGVTGFLFQPHSAKSIVEAVKKLRDLTKEEREQMGIAGRKYVEKHFSRDIVICKYMEETERIRRGKMGEAE